MQHRKLRKNCRNPKTFRTVFIAREIPSSGGMGTKGFSDNLESFHKNTKNAITQMQIQTHKCKYKYTNTNTQNHKYTDSQQQRPGFSNNLECLLLKVQPSAKCIYCHTQIGLSCCQANFNPFPRLIHVYVIFTSRIHTQSSLDFSPPRQYRYLFNPFLHCFHIFGVYFWGWE